MLLTGYPPSYRGRYLLLCGDPAQRTSKLGMSQTSTWRTNIQIVNNKKRVVNKWLEVVRSG